MIYFICCLCFISKIIYVICFVFVYSIKSGLSDKDKELDSLLKSIVKDPSPSVLATEAINDANSIR